MILPDWSERRVLVAAVTSFPPRRPEVDWRRHEVLI